MFMSKNHDFTLNSLEIVITIFFKHFEGYLSVYKQVQVYKTSLIIFLSMQEQFS